MSPRDISFKGLLLWYLENLQCANGVISIVICVVHFSLHDCDVIDYSEGISSGRIKKISSIDRR